ncbi:class E sortase [Streptomyces monticola]|uniref:Class E sortase n=1 Tax=Streptomyces monticola TaxID=2666263 RepID=A0ABW2JK77_9ACTN
MTAIRPERDSGAPYEQSHAYGDAGAFEAAVDRMDDPLNDPLPGQHPSPWFRAEGGEAEEAAQQPPQPIPDPLDPISQAAGHRPAVDASAYEAMYGEGYAQLYTPAEQPYTPAEQPYSPAEQPYVPAEQAYVPEEQPYVPAEHPYAPEQPYVPEETYTGTGTYAHAAENIPVPVDDETVGLRTAETRRAAAESAAEEPGRQEPEGPAEGGRAARRKAAQQAARKGGRRRRTGTGTAASTASAAGSGSAPMSRMEARRAERAKKPSPAVIASRAVGEVFISIGVLMLLFVTYQLWWTNIRAGQEAGSAANKIHQDWASGKRKPGAFEPGQGFAIMHIPRLDVVVPIAEGISKEKVLDRGMVGHYAEGALKTAMPEDKKGNFAVAGHRNTHGEPFRYINRLEKGDKIVVETQDRYYVYTMESILPQTSPSNTDVIKPVPEGSGFTKPGRYLTLTTCTPEFTSTYRMIVWGKMVEERPRSKGKPDALVR